MKRIVIDIKTGQVKGSIDVVENDNKSDIYKIYILKNKAIYDLTGKTPRMVMIDKKQNIKQVIDLNITDAKRGEVSLQVSDAWSRKDGRYVCQLAIFGLEGFLEQSTYFWVTIKNSLFNDIGGEILADPQFEMLKQELEKFQVAFSKIDEWDKYFKETSGKVEEKYTERLNEINSQLSDIAISVKSFGAKGDGVNDDTIAIQNAINKANELETKLLFPAGKYKIKQIILKDNIYEFQSGCKILQSINVPCIVNEFIDLFGHGRKYASIDSIYTAVDNNEVNNLKIEGKLVIEKSSDYTELSKENQLSYSGNAWVDDTYGYMAVFPVNFCGLADSSVENIEIEFVTREANVNLGFSTRTFVEKCILKNGKDNCLQMFACIGCTAGNNKITDGGGGLLVMQNCKLCTFISNSCTYTKPTIGVNSYIISIKNSENCIVIGNNINGFGDINSIGVALTNQGKNNKGIIVSNNTIDGCKHSILNELSDSTSINNNTITNLGSSITDAGIVVNTGTNINILDNKIKSNSSGIALNGGNNINISFNDIRDIPRYFGGVVFGEGNSSTSEYEIKNNKIMSDEVDARGIHFFNNKLYNKKNISKNEFGNIYLGNRLILTNKYIGEIADLPNVYDLQIRKLNEPFLVGEHKDLFRLTKEGKGVYLLEFNYFNKIRFKNTFIFAQYKCGYGNDLDINSLNVVYDDISNSNNDFYAFRICLKDKNNVATDNPTTNSNALNLNNFGINIKITTEYSVV